MAKSNDQKLRAESEPMPEGKKAKAEDDKDKKDTKAEGEDEPKKAEDDDEKKDDDDKDEKSKSKADDGDPSYSDDEENEDKEARASLAKLAGLSASAKLPAIAAALDAKTVPLTAQAKLEGEVADLRAKLEARDKAERQTAAHAFAMQAVKDGRTTEEKRARVETEHAEKGEKAASDLLYAPGTFTALRRFTDGKGNPIGKADKTITFAQDDPAEIEAAMGAATKKIAAEKKIKASAVTGKMIAEVEPDLYAAYQALTRLK